MKKTILIIFLSVFLPFSAVFANGNSLSVADVLSEILETQGADNIKDIDCDLVTKIQFEALGEAVMGKIHPEAEEHEAMDQMMGGEGSESLESVHVNMGKSYLGCGNWKYQGGGGGMMGMMGGGGMMGGSQTPFFGSCGWPGSVFFFTVLSLILIFAVLLAKILLDKIIKIKNEK